MTPPLRREDGEIATARRSLGIRELTRALRAPGSDIGRQGIRFGLAGGAVALVYLSLTTLLAEVVGLPFQAALVIGFSVAIAVHFILQRLFVWVHHEQFALPLHRQVGRYLAVAGGQYGVTAASTALLPSALNVSVEAVYLGTVAVVLGINFLVFRHGIFHAKPPVAERDHELRAVQTDSDGQASIEQRPPRR